ncbi:hypothetical protein ABW18_06080 [Gordonia jacobaea]|uniref:Uncharacterized protein n=1 Tax=Gordonia jacobaea TaxID=122202 RepID=A0ABR5IDX8_9ACTN|nr:hypothetical protein ABW18_06080 [Gordonia jacobaea]
MERGSQQKSPEMVFTIVRAPIPTGLHTIGCASPTAWKDHAHRQDRTVQLRESRVRQAHIFDAS